MLQLERVKILIFVICVWTNSIKGQWTQKKEVLGCPEDTNIICKKIGEKVYLIDGKTNVNWHEADRLCKRYNANLVTIESEEELNALSAQLFENNFDVGDHWFWTGLNDLGSEGTFYSLKTGRAAPYLRWTSGQPDNAGSNENCVNLWRHESTFSMNDLNCLEKRHFICELEQPLFNVRVSDK